MSAIPNASPPLARVLQEPLLMPTPGTPTPRTTPNEHDKPVFQPGDGTPTPEDPRQREPMRDPPVDPEHDEFERQNPVRQAGGEGTGDPLGGETIEDGADDSDPDDQVLFDENGKPG
jgi:hypothetical protein